MEEDVDVVVGKPALPYLDVVLRVRETTNLPVAAFDVSGEYSMLKAAAQNGWLDEERAVLEALTGIKRAGAEIIISYHAPGGCLLADRITCSASVSLLVADGRVPAWASELSRRCFPSFLWRL